MEVSSSASMSHLAVGFCHPPAHICRLAKAHGHFPLHISVPLVAVTPAAASPASDSHSLAMSQG